jgi:hypothetical protein
MAQPTDLYSILRAYANKNNSPYINITPFLEFLERYANRKAPEAPEWAKWAADTNVKFWGELSVLAENEKCTLMPDSAEGRIYMPFYCQDQLRDIYKDIENQSDLPFPDETSIGIAIPPEQLRIVNPEKDMGIFFAVPAAEGVLGTSLHENETRTKGAPDSGETDGNATYVESLNPNHIVKINFPDGYGSALVPVPMIPRRLMEISFLKIRHYLRSHNNREYVLHKLSPQLQGREKYLAEILDQIMIRPFDCLRSMEDYADFAYLFWTYFCTLIKNDIKKKNELLSEDMAAIQAAYIIEACNGFYRARVVKKRELEIAFKNLELRMEKPPFHFTLDDITKFTTDKGVLLLGAYSPRQLEAYLKKRTTESEKNSLPDWLILQGTSGVAQQAREERWYIKKIKYLSLCAKLLSDARPEVKKAITKRWIKLLKEFRGESAMEKDTEFDKLLKTYTANISPTLIALLDDEKLLWVYEELQRSQEIPASSRIFKNGRLLSLSALLAIGRKDILSDVKIMLPFWYSVPIVSAIAAFFKNLGRKKHQRHAEAAADPAEQIETASPQVRELQNSVRVIGMDLVPKGQSLDAYLEELEGRWSRLLDKNARQNLIEDVRTLVRDSLRFESRILKAKKIREANLGNLADDIISHNQTLRGMQGRESLRLYIMLYLVKLLLTFKF